MEKTKLVFPVVAVRGEGEFDADAFEKALDSMAKGEISEEDVLLMFPQEEVRTPMLLVRWPSRLMKLPEKLHDELKAANKPTPSINISSSFTGAALAGLDKISERLQDGKLTGVEIEFDIENLKLTRTCNYMYLSADSVDLDNLVDIEPVFKCSEEASEELIKKARMLNRLASMRIRANMGREVISPSGNIITDKEDQQENGSVDNTNPF